MFFLTLSLLTPLTVSAQTFPVNNNLHWSGITWYVPATHSNTWVDDQNNLHMKLEKINDRWCGSLLESRNTVKYGKFTWVVSSPSLNLERNTTVGLFLYHDDRNELDIEINQWPGTDQHLYFVNQPGSVGDHPENISYGVFSSNPHLNDKNIVYSIEWTPDYVYYSATAEDGTVILDWTYSNPEGIPAINSAICMDILPLAGSYYPVSGNAAEIVLRSFTYTPYDSSWTEPKQKPVASFSASTTSGSVPLKVAFTDKSTGVPTSWNWNFGDGTSSTEKNPTHTYSTAGTYAVTLTATNAAGSNMAAKSNYITVTGASSQKPVNNNLHWSGITWYVPATHSNTWVDDQNNLHMKLEKINDRWCGSLLESRNTVKYGKFTWVVSSPSLNLERNTTVGLFLYHDDRNELDIEINQWPGTDQHLYFVNQPGSVGDHPENISYGVFSSNPHLNDKNIVYSIEWTPDYVYYSATAEDGTVILDWTYSNPEGIPAINSAICMDILPLAGSYYPVSGNAAEIVLRSFTYTPYDSSWTEPKQKPVASFSASTTSGSVPLKVAFTDKSTGVPTSWNWNFGDGTSSTEKNPTHTYSKPGTYAVTLTATNAAGSNTATKSSYIIVAGTTVGKPVINCWGSPRMGTAPLTVYFKDRSTGSPTSWGWDFGDGTYSTLQNPKHTYSAAGKYTVKLTVTNAAGSTSTTKYNYIVSKP